MVVAYHKIPIRATGRMAGIYIQQKDGKTIAVRHARPEHMLQKPKGWAFSGEVVDFLKQQSAEEIIVRCGDDEYECAFERFLALSIAINRGFGPQLALPLRYWTIIGHQKTVKEREQNGQKQPLLFA